MLVHRLTDSDASPCRFRKSFTARLGGSAGCFCTWYEAVGAEFAG
jgi:hypothetical protein